MNACGRFILPVYLLFTYIRCDILYFQNSVRLWAEMGKKRWDLRQNVCINIFFHLISLYTLSPISLYTLSLPSHLQYFNGEKINPPWGPSRKIPLAYHRCEDFQGCGCVDPRETLPTEGSWGDRRQLEGGFLMLRQRWKGSHACFLFGRESLDYYNNI